MCGIAAVFNPTTPEIIDQVANSIKPRGPDSYQSVLLPKLPNLTLHASVLSLRPNLLGKAVVQPITNKEEGGGGGTLCFNGEIFASSLPSFSFRGSDTMFLLSALSSASSVEEILSVLRSLSGPFSLLYFSPSHSQLFFARDGIGRRSLLIGTNFKSVHPSFRNLCSRL